MKRIFFFLCVVTSLQSCNQTTITGESNSYADAMTLDTSAYNSLHKTYREVALTNRRFKHQDIVDLVKVREEKDVLQVAEIGKSVESRAIYKLRYGNGDKKVMLWSQMHGDEPTATMALFDIFNFLEGGNDGFDSIRIALKDNLTIHFIPMLNPDGAERFIRRNAQYVDLNRDARANHTVEAKLLRRMAEEIKPNYGFNLHDQSIYYNVPGTKNPVTIAMLAPAYNADREVNDVRKGAMQLIVGMNNLLQQYIPDAVAKYDDTYSPRGFGDNFQAWGASTVLIESGGLKGDPEKQEIRRFNFAIILNALLEIAQGSYKKYDYKAYDKIPFNASQLHDVVIRQVDLGTDSVPLKTDIAIRRAELTVERDYCVRGWIEDIGDLEGTYGYDELDAGGLKFVQGKVYPKVFQTVDDISNSSAWELLKDGYIAVRVMSRGQDRLHNLPLVIAAGTEILPTPRIVLTGTSNFFLGDGATLKYAVVNGYLIDLSQPPLENFYKNWIN
ncbi:M14 family zinc carboxypeptidase [Sphingobacterium haloxyli]|uniref:Peptidase M14 n=1 Tax=Sphingobacterium haloxyli TaxID=2100533 RepID=A0A2S9J5Q3_9SPHI|nr:M14 family zinc carboxypeptidase [Sphingobacterium haloxyli]PRD48101.1 peptidase M14 [Sphingobacterium haloxyli]